MGYPLRLDLLCASGTVTSARGAVEPRRKLITACTVPVVAGARILIIWKISLCFVIFVISALTLGTRIWLAFEPPRGKNSEPLKLIPNSSSTVVITPQQILDTNQIDK
jgi:hypothetical protein